MQHYETTSSSVSCFGGHRRGHRKKNWDRWKDMVCECRAVSLCSHKDIGSIAVTEEQQVKKCSKFSVSLMTIGFFF